MVLITKEIEAKLPRVGATESIPVEEKIVQVKFFDPCGAGTWWVVEYDPATRECFGFAQLGLGPDCDEWGYIGLDELERLPKRFGLGIERDRGFRPKPFWRCVPDAVDAKKLAVLQAGGQAVSP